MTNKTIIVAGGTRNLGGRMIREILNKQVEVRVLLHSNSNN